MSVENNLYLLTYHFSITLLTSNDVIKVSFLPRCMQCRRGLTTSKLYVCPSVCQTRGLCKNGRKICTDFYNIQNII